MCTNAKLRSSFERAVSDFTDVHFSKTYDSYPSVDVLRRAILAWAPEVYFLDIENAQAAETIAGVMEKEFPGVQGVALHSSQAAPVFRRVLQLRMKELLSAPFNRSELRRVVGQLEEHLESHPANIGSTDRFFAYMPAKPGVGASTIAANATWAFSKAPDARVLLADLDASSGVTGFLFNTESEHGLMDLAKRGTELDSDSWERIVAKVGNIDLLLSKAPTTEPPLSSGQIAHMVDFARRNYSVINADLSDALDETSLAVLREANRIFLVTTCDLGALRMARLKARLFSELGLTQKVALLVNRVSKRMDLSTQEIAETVGLPVFATFPCDYADLQKSIRAGQPSGSLAASMHRFTELVLNKQSAEEKPDKRRRFIEYFAVARGGMRV